MKNVALKPGALSMMALMLIAGLLLQNTVWAQDENEGREGNEHAAAIKELRERFQTWFRAEVAPSLNEWKAELDGAMSPGDLATLNQLRGEAKEVRKTIRAGIAGMRKAWRDEDYDALKTYRRQLSDAKKKRIDIIDQVTPLAITYRETLLRIGEEAKPNVKGWKEEAQEILEQWRSEYEAEVSDEIGTFFARKAFLHNRFNYAKGKGGRAIWFMLWDGDSGPDDEMGTVEEPVLK